ncbi:MAG: isoprenylcysteine carboxylmethyltransferase family protein [Candidatus Thermoplasmatota archaeon]
MFFLEYKPPKKLRALFIAHYAPLLLIILIGPLTAIYGVWKIPIKMIYSIIIGLTTFIIGSYVYFKWEIFWHKNYHGQLVTEGIFNKIRHPHYTSLLIVGYGLAFFFCSTAALLIATLAIPIMIWSILDEEKILLKKYGEEYRKYMEKVPWRIIPKIF